MPKTLDAFPRTATQLYPWDQLMDGQVWQLTRGEDYTAKTNTVLANARTQAKRRGGTVRTRIVNDAGRESLVIQFRRP
jgi:hypothetical protein